MKILWTMRHPAYMRNFESVMRKMLDNGHVIKVLYTGSRTGVDDSLARELAASYQGFNYRYPVPPKMKWTWWTRRVRAIRNYIRYFHPELQHCDKLKARAVARTPKVWVKCLEALPVSLANRLRPTLDKLMQYADRVAPVAPNVRDYVKHYAPDMLLLTPLVDMDSHEIEYVKVAGQIGIPSCLCVASWDNLTNKGIIQGNPSFVIVWNEIQKQEAIRLHGIKPERIYLTGAQLFDQWFDMEPSVSRDEFCERLGFDPDQKIITYVCSSGFISKEEPNFVLKWVEELRRSTDPKIANANILIRPHPASGPKLWGNPLPEFNDHTPLRIYPKDGEIPMDSRSKGDYFTALYWSDAVVGINTSAFIEASIVGKPCFTIELPDHAGTQAGTVHYRYLKEGGCLIVSKGFEEHAAQMVQAINDRGFYEDSRLGFVKDFVRPCGLDVSATERFYGVIHKELPSRKSEALQGVGRVRTYHYVLRTLLKPFFSGKVTEVSGKEYWQPAQRKRGKKFKAAGDEALVVTRKAKEYDFPELKLLEKMQPYFINREAIYDHLRDISKTNSKIVLGPWICEVGFELLYWIPFLRWIQHEFGLTPDRCIVMSRGGVSSWYHGLATQYEDIFSYMSVDEFHRSNEQRIEDSGGGRKHWKVSRLEEDILRKVGAKVEAEELKRIEGIANETERKNALDKWNEAQSARKAQGYSDQLELIHPSLMYTWFMPFWRDLWGCRMVATDLKFMAIPKPPKDILVKMGLENERYVAVKFYKSGCLRQGEQNEKVVANLVEQLTREYKVVVLDTQFRVDDHSGYSIPESDRVVNLARYCTAENNLALQTEVVAHAEAFYGTYGGFSYLAPLCGVNSYNYYDSMRALLMGGHAEVAEKAFNQSPFGQFHPIYTKAFD